MKASRFAINISQAILAIIIPISALSRELSTQDAVNSLATLLTEAGEAIFNKDGKHPSPQILFGIAGTSTYGSCVDQSNSNIIPGSFYCAKTNTIILEVNQLETLRRQYGDGAVVYALAHEYGHYIQRYYELRNSTIYNELQADCMAGVILNNSAKRIGLDQNDLREVLITAAAVGGGTHGTPKQRAGAVLQGWQSGDFKVCGLGQVSINTASQAGIDASQIAKPSSAANKPSTSKTPHPGGRATFIGLYALYGPMVPIYRDDSKGHQVSNTIKVKVHNDYSKAWQSFLAYVDCGTSRFSFFPDLPNSKYSFLADARMLLMAKCQL